MNYKESLVKTYRSFRSSITILIGVLLLLSLMLRALPKSFYLNVFSGNYAIDPFLGAIFGSVAAGNPITSYIIGGELLKEGISIVAITSFILSWVTVGIIQLPAESIMLGKRFSIARNLVSFVFSILIAIATVITLGVL